MMFDIQLFAGGHAVTVVKGTNVTTASASATSDVQKDAEVTLTIACGTGYEPVYEVLAGGVTINETTKKFVMGETDVTIVVKAKKSNNYMVTEECKASINGGAWTVLHKNTVVSVTPNGVVKGVTCEGTVISSTTAIQGLIDQGILVKI